METVRSNSLPNPGTLVVLATPASFVPASAPTSFVPAVLVPTTVHGGGPFSATLAPIPLKLDRENFSF